jgi:hypothetical protein
MLLDRAGDLYKDYSAWKEARGEHPLSQTRWGEQMGRRFEKIVAAAARYRGIRLLIPPTEGYGGLPPYTS